MNAWIQVLSGAKLEQRAQVVDVRVDAAVGDEPEQVDAPPAFERRRERRAPDKRAVRDRAVHALQVLQSTRPEPIVRWPTSELPIWPAGSPAASPEASSVVCG